jgi:SET domain-containing protein
MVDILIPSTKLIITKSEIHGWGVFASEDIEEKEILEEAPFIIVPRSEISSYSITYKYTYYFSDLSCILPFGCSGLYNHSYSPNADFRLDENRQTITHYSIKKIKKGEEIFINYGEENAKYFT